MRVLAVLAYLALASELALRTWGNIMQIETPDFACTTPHPGGRMYSTENIKS